MENLYSKINIYKNKIKEVQASFLFTQKLNKMKKTYILLLFLALISCSKSNEEISNRSFTVNIENENFTLINENITANENCDNLFVSARYTTPNDIGFKLEFKLTKKGAIRNVALYNYREASKQYESADFNPTGKLTLKNFNYDQDKNTLSFDFEGYLIEVDSNIGTIDVQRNQKYIKGKMNIDALTKTACNNTIGDITIETNNLKFYTSKTLGTNTPSLTLNPYAFDFFSDNGYKISFKNNVDLWDVPIGNYSFTETTPESRINFEEYIGNFRATQLLWIRLVDWKVYSTAGNFKIKEHKMLNGLKVTRGEFDLNVSENNVSKYSLKNIAFQVIGF